MALSLFALVTFCSWVPSAQAFTEKVIRFRHFGKVTVYIPTGATRHVALFVSGDGGWDHGIVNIAQAVTEPDTVVVGIDIKGYLRAIARSKVACSSPAADFEALSQYVQKKIGLTDYIRPVLVGYSSGATLVYALLVQSPVRTFDGGMSIGFCPDLRLKKPLCKTNGLDFTAGRTSSEYLFLPAKELKTPWAALNGADDKVCIGTEVERFVAQVPQARLTLIRSVGHGFAAIDRWLPTFRHTIAELERGGAPTETDEAVRDLPLVEVPAARSDGAEPPSAFRDTFAVIISGDGGWAGIDRELAAELVHRGIPTVGVDSLRYFWKRKTPDGTAQDLSRILTHYGALWHRSRVLLAGYSLGADVLPFMVSRLPAELKNAVRRIALLGPDGTVDFEFHLLEWIEEEPRGLPTLPELQKLPAEKVLCVFGEREDESLCRNLPKGSGRAVRVPGGHHFDGDYRKLADTILAGLESEKGPALPTASTSTAPVGAPPEEKGMTSD